MADLRIYFGDQRIGERFSRGVQRQRDIVLKSMRGAAETARKEVETRGRADIRRASPAFAKSKRWAPGFKVKMTQGGGTLRLTATSTIDYFLIHQTGGVIRAKNPSGLLWIPLDFAKDAQGVSARDFSGTLFRVDRQGRAPLLLSAEDGEPKYFGKEKVTIPKRFHIFEIIRDVAKKFKETYRKELRANRGT